MTFEIVGDRPDDGRAFAQQGLWRSRGCYQHASHAERHQALDDLVAQAREFKEVADITGIILTKLDGTAKGGIAVAIHSELGIPVKYIGVGETIDDLQKFNADEFVNALFDVKTSEERN